MMYYSTGLNLIHDVLFYIAYLLVNLNNTVLMMLISKMLLIVL